MSCLYIFILIPCQLLHLKIFSPILRAVVRSYLFILVCIFITPGDGFKKILLQFMSKCILCFPLRVLVSGLGFRSSIHFEFSFMYSVKEYSDLIFYM